jgi:hypothetical protein
MEKKLIYNAIRTPDGTVLVSYHRHDYKTHLDANGEEYMIDGGTDYIRTNVNKIPAEDLSLYDDAPFEQIREVIHRGGRGVDGTEPLKYVKLSEVNDDWLQAIIDYESQYRPNNRFLKYYFAEKVFRREGKVDEKALSMYLTPKEVSEMWKNFEE